MNQSTSPITDHGRVSVVIVTWNSAESIARCLECVLNQTYGNLEIIVVDNASSDSSVQLVRAVAPDACLVALDHNSGFCEGQNTGIARATGEYVMPLNPDVELSPTYVAALVDSLRLHPEAGTACGKLLLPGSPPRIDSTGMFVNRARRQYIRGHGEEDLGQYDTAGLVFGACGAAPLYRRTMIDDIAPSGELFDVTFFAHKEDLDVSWRAQLRGWKAWYSPAAVATHDRSFRPGRRGVMTGEVRLHAVKNRYLTMAKNDLPVNWLRDAAAISFYEIQILTYLVLRERSSLKALPLAARALPNALRQRKATMRQRRVSAKYIRGAMSE